MEMDGAEGGQRGFSNPLHHPPPRLQTPNSGELESHSDRFATPLLKGMCKLSFLHLIFFFLGGGLGVVSFVIKCRQSSLFAFTSKIRCGHSGGDKRISEFWISCHVFSRI